MIFIQKGKTNWKFLLIVFILAAVVGGGVLWLVWDTQLKGFCKSDNECQFFCGCGCVLKYNLSNLTRCPRPNILCEYDPCNFCRCLNGKCVSWSDIFIEAQHKKDINLCQEIRNEDCKKQCLEVLTNLIKEDGTADWQTYRNEEYGYEIKYPKEYIINEEKITSFSDQEIYETPTCYREFSELTESLRKLSAVEILASEEIKTAGRSNMYVRVYNNFNNLTLNQWLDFWDKAYSYFLKTACDIKGTEDIINRKNFSTNALKGIQGFGGCCGGCEKEIFFSKNDKIYNLSLLGGSPGGVDCEGDDCCSGFSSIDELIFNQMLSTFRFLE